MQALDRALTLAETIADEEHRAEVLRGLAPVLSGEPLDRAWALADVLPHPWIRLRALAVLSARYPEDRRAEAADHLLALVDELADAYDRAHELALLAPELPRSRRRLALGRALTAAGAIANPYLRDSAVRDLVPLLSQEELERALDVVAGIGDDERRMNLLAELAARLPEPRRDELLNRRSPAQPPSPTSPSATRRCPRWPRGSPVNSSTRR